MRFAIAASTLAGLATALTTSAPAAETVRYNYDVRGRLATTTVTSAGSLQNAQILYSYDAAGNRNGIVMSNVPTPEVVNASLEQPAVGAGFQYNPGVAGNYFASLSGVQGNGSAWGFANAPSGTQTGFIQGIGTSHGNIVMNVSGLTVGDRYAVQMMAAQRPGYVIEPIYIAFQNNNLGNHQPASTAWAPITTPSFVATDTVGALSMLGVGGDNSNGATGIDAVTIVRVP